jgi:PST family polysaccharide transporter
MTGRTSPEQQVRIRNSLNPLRITNSLKKDAQEFKGVVGRIRRREFSGNEGQAIKNSTYQLMTLIVSKVGSILFTMVLARLLMPELFGLYGLTISTILLFASFADLGVGSTLVTFISRHIDSKNSKKTKAFYKKIFSMKVLLMITICLSLVISSRFIAQTYYGKPIFLALVMGIFYIIFSQLFSFLELLFQAANDFKQVFFKEIIFQVIRLILVPLTILYFSYLDVPGFVAILFLSLSLSYLVPLVYLWIMSKRKMVFLREKSRKLSPKENKEIWQFLVPLSTVALSGILFGYVDMIMLGHYVSSEFLGYYHAALNLAGSLFAIVAFSSAALFPIFGRLTGARLERGFKRSRRMIALISIASCILVYFTASIGVNLIYGQNYSQAIPLLEMFSLLMISSPLIALYQTYYISRGETKAFSKIIIFSTLLNILLNFIFITGMLQYGEYYSIVGAALATVVSKFVFLVLLAVFRKRT